MHHLSRGIFLWIRVISAITMPTWNVVEFEGCKSMLSLYSRLFLPNFIDDLTNSLSPRHILGNNRRNIRFILLCMPPWKLLWLKIYCTFSLCKRIIFTWNVCIQHFNVQEVPSRSFLLRENICSVPLSWRHLFTKHGSIFSGILPTVSKWKLLSNWKFLADFMPRRHVQFIAGKSIEDFLHSMRCGEILFAREQCWDNMHGRKLLLFFFRFPDSLP